jgi:DNA-binding CsgD family transcriptional regulator
VSLSRAGVSAQGLTTICEIAAVASSGLPDDEGAHEAIERLRRLIPIEAAGATSVDPVTGRHRFVASTYTDRLVDHLTSASYQREIVEPYVLPAGGWPVRERDLGVDPMSLTCIADYFRPEGLTEGLTSALVTADGRYVGLLDVSVSDRRHPSDEACAVIGRLAPVLANVIDPLRSARALAATLDRDATAIAVTPSGHAFPLLGEDAAGLIAREPELIDQITTAVASKRPPAAFVWPRAKNEWYACRSLRCRDATTVVLVREEPDVHQLTLRELQVLTCLVQGMSNAETAELLVISHRTARAHVEHIFAKLEVSTRAGAVARATREGLVLSACAAGVA